jgi:hypothetical protein
MYEDIEVHLSGAGFGGAVLVVVAIGTDVYGATSMEALDALHVAASRAAEDRALRGFPVDPQRIMDRGLAKLPSPAHLAR